MRRLYDSKPSGNSYKCRLLISQLAIPCEVIQVDIFKGESRTDDFKRKVHPAGRVPVLEEDGFFLAESNAILCYLARGSLLYAEEPKTQARILQWMFFEQNQLELPLGVSRYFKKFKPEHPKTEENLRFWKDRGEAALKVLDDTLRSNDFLVGQYSIADICLFAYTHTAEEGGFSLEPYQHVRAWIERVQGTPGFVPQMT